MTNEKPICERCGEEFEPRFLDLLNKHSSCCDTCGCRNIIDALGLPTPPELLDRFTKRPTLTKQEYKKELAKPIEEEEE